MAVPSATSVWIKKESSKVCSYSWLVYVTFFLWVLFWQFVTKVTGRHWSGNLSSLAQPQGHQVSIALKIAITLSKKQQHKIWNWCVGGDSPPWKRRPPWKIPPSLENTSLPGKYILPGKTSPLECTMLLEKTSSQEATILPIKHHPPWKDIPPECTLPGKLHSP